MIREFLAKMIRDAVKSKNTDDLYVLKMIKAEFLKFETSKGYSKEQFTEAKEISILQKMYKTWKEEVDLFKGAGRDTDELERRLRILESYIPREASKEEIQEYIKTYSGEISIKEMRKILAYVQQKYPTASGKLISDIVRSYG